MDIRTIIGRPGWTAGIGAAIAVAGIAEGGAQLVELPVPEGTQYVEVTDICPTADFAVGFVLVNQSPLAVSWRGGCGGGQAQMTYLPDADGGMDGPSHAWACGINDAGERVIVGDSWNVDEPVATVWVEGVVDEFVSTGVQFPWAIGYLDCSADGCVRVGEFASDGPPFMPLGQVCGAPHFIFPMKAPGSIANCVSPDGILVGMERLADGGWRVYNRNIGDFTTDYDLPPGEGYGYATDIRDNGGACGNTNTQVVRWDANGTAEPLDQMPDEFIASAYGMANNRTVVGSSTNDVWQERGVLWPGGDTAVIGFKSFLGDQGITVPPGIEFTSVSSISGDGKRMGATMVQDGETYACIAYLEGACDGLEVPGCTGVLGDMNGDGVVNTDDLDGFVAAVLGGPNAECADVNGDGQLNLDDITEFIDRIDDQVPGGLVTVGAERAPVPAGCAGRLFELRANLTIGDQIALSGIEIQLDHADYALTQHPDGDDFPPTDSELLADPTRACDTYGDIPMWFFDDPEAIIAVLESSPLPNPWVFRAALTDVEIDLKVEDTGGPVARYGIDGPFAPIIDTEAFSGVPAAGNASSAPRIGTIRVELTTVGNAPVVDVFEFDIVLGGPCTDGLVGFDDLVQLLGNWGPCVDCTLDIDADGSVGFNDLSILLGLWGPCI